MNFNIRLLKDLAYDTKLNIVLYMMDKERNVLDIVSLVKKSQPAISIALRKLEDAVIVESRKEGKMIFYSIKSKEFVEKNNGTIRIESKENEGSKFTFTVPLYKNSSE